MEDRQGERSGLAGAGLGDTDQVAAVEDCRYGRRLDRRRRYIARFGKRATNGLGKAERCEWHVRSFLL